MYTLQLCNIKGQKARSDGRQFKNMKELFIPYLQFSVIHLPPFLWIQLVRYSFLTNGTCWSPNELETHSVHTERQALTSRIKHPGI